MNAAFEDCYALDRLLETQAEWGALFADFERERRANVAAIAQMAIENYGEMRERVLDAQFLRQQAWARELERQFPERFIPRYSMVMFHPEISYAEALRRGAMQQEILDALSKHAGDSSSFDGPLAEHLIRTRLEMRRP
jgi:kynurenine 3-monooxygenase